MIKKSLFGGAVVLLLVALFAGRGVVSYITTAAGRVEERVKSSVPVKFEIERARQMLKALTPEIERNMHLIAREEVEIAKLERELAQNEEQVATSQKEILQLKGDLESGNSQFVYAGNSYSEGEVKQDLANRFEHFKTVEATTEQLKQVLRARQNGLEAAHQKLENMLAAKRQLAVDIENLEARLKMIKVAQTSSQFSFDDSKLSRTRELVNEIGTRMDVTEKLMNHHVESSGRIPLEEREAGGTEDVLDEITKHFSEQPEHEAIANSETH
ncbi:MAG: hypothetical protein ACODAD_03880 [Planctomycetota bacterium]